MSPDPRSQELLRKWAAESAVPVEEPMASQARRERVVARMELVMGRHAEARIRRRRIQTGAAVACAAAVIALVATTWRAQLLGRSASDSGAPRLGVARLLGGTANATHDGRTEVVSASTIDDILRAGDDLVTGEDGRLEVDLNDGVAMIVEPATRIRMPEDEPSGSRGRERVRLDAGRVQIRVPHLVAGRTFAVKTPDAEVVVHGTAFSVEVGRFDSPDAPLHVLPSLPGDVPVTRVRVSEGIVSIASRGRETFVTAGMQWMSPSDTGLPASPPPATSPPAAEVTDRGPARSPLPLESSRTPSAKSSANPSSAAGAHAAPSSLGEQNHLLASAIEASRRGDHQGAIDQLNRLLTRFPGSPLAQEAAVERFRALEHAGDHAAAAREARRYLVSYPDGFAREEARKLALEP
jgi:FecR protein/Outer membrane lipoprotein